MARTTPSHPKVLSGRRSTSMTTSTIFSRSPFSTEASFSAQVCRTFFSPCHTVTSIVMRCSTV